MLKRFYAKAEEIPAGMESLYTEKDGKFVLSGVEGIEGLDSVTTLEKTLGKVRVELKAAQDKLKAFGDIKAEDAVALQTKVDELQLQIDSAGATTDTKVADLVKARLAVVTAPLDRKINDLTTQRDEAVKKAAETAAERKRDRITLAISEAATAAGVLPAAVSRIVQANLSNFDMDDEGRVLTREVSGIVPGQDPKTFVGELKTTDPYFWPTSQGGGATGGDTAGLNGGVNPYKKETWSLTAIAKIEQSDPKTAARLAAAAGVAVGANAPKA